MSLFLLVFAMVAGALLPTQAGINAQLAKTLGHPLLAASVSFTLGTLALLLYTFVFHISWPEFSRAMQAPWYLWIGGLLGVIYLTATIIWTTPRARSPQREWLILPKGKTKSPAADSGCC
jgi:transporter family-2 protein